MVHTVGEADDSQSGFHVLAAFGLGKLGQEQGKFNILERRQHWNKVVHLKDETDVAGAPVCKLAGGHMRDFIAVNGDAARRGYIQAAEEIE